MFYCIISLLHSTTTVQQDPARSNRQYRIRIFELLLQSPSVAFAFAFAFAFKWLMKVGSIENFSSAIFLHITGTNLLKYLFITQRAIYFVLDFSLRNGLDTKKINHGTVLHEQVAKVSQMWPLRFACKFSEMHSLEISDCQIE